MACTDAIVVYICLDNEMFPGFCGGSPDTVWEVGFRVQI